MRLARALVIGIAAVVAAGCATRAPLVSEAASIETRCEAYLAELDAIVAAAGVADAEAARVRGFRYLRTDRFLASFRNEVSEERFAEWIDALRRLDRDGRDVELANLPPEQQPRVRDAARAAGLMDVLPAVHVHGCGTVLAARDGDDPEARARLREAAVVPDDYATWKRVLGLYAVTRVPFAWGVRDYERDVRATFAQPVESLPLRGTLVRHGPAYPERAAPAEARAITARVAAAGARFAVPEREDVDALLALHAPILEIDAAVPEDAIGIVRRDAGGAPFVDVARPAVYGRVVFTRFEGRVLPQAVYTAWFPGRPRTSAVDLLGGDWDGLVWRVTLDTDGAPLVFDTMHACGCYHMFFPTARLAMRPRPDTLDEWALAPQSLPAPAAGEPVRLRVASRTHYVQRVAIGSPPPERTYTLVPETRLRLLTATDGRSRSLYGPDGIVAGSERGERYLFWPMGIREPGAMRQWGRHATAFVGRRHFDDADLLERYFTRAPRGG
jgi:hypothetical protein